MTTSEVLRTAKDILLRDGWCQGVLENPITSEKCTIGAVEATGVERYSSEEIAVSAVLRSLVPPPPPKTMNPRRLNAVAFWNDAPDRTPEDVLDLFDRAIAKAETLDGREVEVLA